MPVECVGNPLTRRLLLQTSALAATAGVAPAAWASPPGSVDVQVAIVGAGIAGLNTAYQLAKGGITDVAIYEAGPAVGGRIRTLVAPFGTDVSVELGGEFVDSGHTDVLALANELQLTLFDFAQDVQANPQIPEDAYLIGGVEYTEVDLAVRLQPLAARIAADAADVDADFETFAPAIDALSVEDYLDDFVNTNPGGLDPVARAFVEQGIRSEWGARPQDASALTLIFNLPVSDGVDVQSTGSSDRRYSIVGGNQQLVDGLAAAVGSQRIHTQHMLTAVSEDPHSYTLTFAGGQVVRAEFVVITIPFPQLRKVQLSLLPSTSMMFDQALASYELGINDKLIVGYSSRVWRGPGGFQADHWMDSVAVAWEATRREPASNDAFITYLFGGSDAFDAFAGSSDAAIAQALTAELELANPGLSQVATGQVLATGWRTDPLFEGAYSTFGPGGFTSPSYLAWYIDPAAPQFDIELRKRGLVLAGEHLSTYFSGYMQGGAETGRYAAESILAAMPLSHG